MADNIQILDGNSVLKTVATTDDGTEHLQRVRANLVALSSGTAPVGIASGQLANQPCNTNGIPFVDTGHPNIKTYRNRYTGAVGNTAIATPTAGAKLEFIGANVTTANANVGDVDVQIGFGATANDASLYSHPGLANNTTSGISGVHKTGATNESIRLTAAVTGGFVGTFDVLCVYYELPN